MAETTNSAYGYNEAGVQAVIEEVRSDLTKKAKNISDSNYFDLVLRMVDRDWIGPDADEFKHDFTRTANELSELILGLIPVIEETILQKKEDFKRAQNTNMNL